MPRLNVYFKDENLGIDLCRICWPPDESMVEMICDEIGVPSYIAQQAVDDCEEPEHPPYSDWDYKCLHCGKLLTDEDN